MIVQHCKEASFFPGRCEKGGWCLFGNHTSIFVVFLVNENSVILFGIEWRTILIAVVGTSDKTFLIDGRVYLFFTSKTFLVSAFSELYLSAQSIVWVFLYFFIIYVTFAG